MNTDKVIDAITEGKAILDKSEMVVLGGNKPISEWDIEIMQKVIDTMKEHNNKFEAERMAKGIIGIDRP